MTASERITIPGGDRPRHAILHSPRRGGRLPLVIMFHGTGGTAAWAADETGWSHLADHEGFAVVYPDGLPLRDDKPAKFLTNPPVWHDGSFGPNDFFHEREDLRFLAALLDLLVGDHGIDPSRVYSTGFSNGGGMCFALAAALADRIAAVAPVAGHCWLGDPRPVRPIPTYYIVGDADPLIPLAGGPVTTPWGWTREKPSVAATLEKWSAAIGCSSDLRPISQDGHSTLARAGCGDDHRRFLVRTIHGLGHHWPGGRGKLSEKIGGPHRTSINACREIWEFFRGTSR